MKKTVLFGIGALLAVGFVTLTAFQKVTKAQQEAEIAAAVTTKLEELRTAKTTECDDRVATEAKTRYDALAAAPATEEPATIAKTGSKKKPTSSKGTSGPKVDPLPQPTPPSKPTVPTTDTEKAKSRIGGETQKVDEAKAKSRVGGEAPKQEEQKAKSRIGGGGGK